MAQSLTSKASLPIARSNDPVTIFVKETRMSRKSAAASKDETVATTTAPVTPAPAKPAKQPKPAKVAKPAPVAENPAEPEVISVSPGSSTFVDLPAAE